MSDVLDPAACEPRKAHWWSVARPHHVWTPWQQTEVIVGRHQTPAAGQYRRCTRCHRLELEAL